MLVITELDADVLADSEALVEALMDADVLADSLALVEALCDADVLDSDSTTLSPPLKKLVDALLVREANGVKVKDVSVPVICTVQVDVKPYPNLAWYPFIW